MNRLQNHLRAMKLAKLHLAQARQDLDKGKLEAAGRNLTHAVELVIVSMNNVTSIAFGAKRRR